MISDNKILSMIGLATKAGKTVTGTTACDFSIRRKNARLVLLATDASENSLSHAIKLCKANDIGYMLFSTKEKLGCFTGKTDRVIIAITDDGFAKRVSEMINDFNNNNK